MAVLQPAFNILTICGCWIPSSYRNAYAKMLYKLYTISVFLLLYSFCTSQFMNLIYVRSADELSDNLYMFIANFLACCKFSALLINRKAIHILRRKLQEEPCKPANEEEIEIQDKFDKNIGSITIYYTILVEATVMSMILSSLFTDFKDQKLAYKAWLPFDYSIPKYYYIAYGHQIIALIGTSLLNVACDVVICGLFVHVCGQQEILSCRLKDITKELTPNIGKVVRFHDYLYGYVIEMKKKFTTIIGIQLLSSTLVVCFILYELANTPLVSSKYLQFVLYLVCMMTQIFFYCWYGNQLKLKSVEVVNTIFEMDWIFLDNSTKKNLINVMRRAAVPIEVSCAYIFAMDLRTFVSVRREIEFRPPRTIQSDTILSYKNLLQILKMSYSTYNLLQRKKQS